MNKNKKALMLGLAVVLAFGSVATGCGDGTPSGHPALNEKIDPNRTQIYAFCYDGGFGVDWMIDLKYAFEDLNKDKKYEEGKQGVQVVIDPKKDLLDIEEIPGNKNELFFTQNAYYYDMLRANILADISDVVTGSLSAYGDDSSVYDKLTQEQRAYYGVTGTDEQTHYYGIPHYSVLMQMVYNVELFDQKGYYFLDEPTGDTLEDCFVYIDENGEENGKRSAGPDGEYDTFDDGLPATYEEFFKLCDYIYQSSDIPLTWGGKSYRGYLVSLAQTLAVDYEGAQQSMLYYKMDGSNATNLGTVTDGQFVKDTTPTAINSTNAYELFRQEGKYHALSFIEKIVKTENYHNELAFNTGHSHMDAQTDFLNAGHDGVTNESAILIDGNWWENEATSSFNSMVDSKGDAFSKKNRKFAYMPLPKATAEKALETANKETKFTLNDYGFSLMYMKKNVAEWKAPLLKEFLKFCNTNKNLVNFTKITGAVKSLTYSATPQEIADMTPYAQSVLKVKAVSETIIPSSTHATYINNQLFFTPAESYYSTLKSGTTMQYPAEAFHEEGVDAEEYFNGIYEYFSEQWGTLR